MSDNFKEKEAAFKKFNHSEIEEWREKSLNTYMKRYRDGRKDTEQQ